MRRGLDIDPSVLEGWGREPRRANMGKVWEPYHYPESFLGLLAFIGLPFHMPYRHTEEFARLLSGFAMEDGLQVSDYSTINRRLNRLRVDLGGRLVKSKGAVSVAVDASGAKVHNGRDWIRRVWKVRKGYLKIHFAVDIKTGQVVSMDATSERVGNGRHLRRLVGRR